MRQLIVFFVLVFHLGSLCFAADCDCSYHPGGCSIATPAQRGFKCKCLYKGFWTCGGAAFPCADDENCPGGLADYCTCSLGGGDCGAYSDADSKFDCSKSNHHTTSVLNTKADCDCCYHSGGCSICKPPPSGFKCVCSYKGFWTCSGWAQGCNSKEYCPGGSYKYCACKQGGGDCGAYPEAKSKPSCDYSKPKPKTCNCNRDSDWTSSSYDISNVEYDISKLQRTNVAAQAIGTKDIPNASDAQQTVQFWVTKGLTTQSSFSHQHGISISVGVSFQAGLPSNSVTKEISVGKSYDFTWGETKSISLTFSNRFTCNGPPKQHTRCEVSLQRGNAKVPYIMTLTHKTIPDCKCTSSGMYSGIDVFDHRLIAKKIGPCDFITHGDCGINQFFIEQ